MTETDVPSGLTPANENPWYVLMTLYGEQEGTRIDRELAKKNRDAWNRWFCRFRVLDELKKLADRTFVDFKAAELSVTEGNAFDAFVEAEFRRRLPDKDSQPNRSARINFDSHAFERPLGLSGYILPDISFVSSHFQQSVRLDGSLFNGFVLLDD